MRMIKNYEQFESRLDESSTGVSSIGKIEPLLAEIKLEGESASYVTVIYDSLTSEYVIFEKIPQRNFSTMVEKGLDRMKDDFHHLKDDHEEVVKVMIKIMTLYSRYTDDENILYRMSNNLEKFSKNIWKTEHKNIKSDEIWKAILPDIKSSMIDYMEGYEETLSRDFLEEVGFTPVELASKRFGV